jgi:hypothetical protein
LEFGILLGFGFWVLGFQSSQMKTAINSEQFQLDINRRTFLRQSAYGLGDLAPARCSIRNRSGAREPPPARPLAGHRNPPHFPVRAKR